MLVEPNADLLYGFEMIDMPQTLPPAYEQILSHKLQQCGLKSGGFTVKYENHLQAFSISIGHGAGASAEHLECISQVADQAIVMFDDPGLHLAYQDRKAEQVRPAMMKDARAELERHGALANFPERADFGSDQSFAEALELHCGMSPGSFFIAGQGGVIRPFAFGGSGKSDEKAACMIAAIKYVIAKGENFDFGFVGNAAIAPEE